MRITRRTFVTKASETHVEAFIKALFHVYFYYLKCMNYTQKEIFCIVM
jgi:hypothetical protein